MVEPASFIGYVRPACFADKEGISFEATNPLTSSNATFFWESSNPKDSSIAYTLVGEYGTQSGLGYRNTYTSLNTEDGCVPEDFEYEGTCTVSAQPNEYVRDYLQQRFNLVF